MKIGNFIMNYRIDDIYKMGNSKNNSIFRSLAKGILFAAGIVILLWFLAKIATILLLLLFAVVVALVINAPVTWLEKRKVSRIWASVLVFTAIALILALLGWLIIPKISSQLTTLVNNLPDYATQLSKKVSSWTSDYPAINEKLQKDGNDVSQWVPSLPKALQHVGNYSLSLLGALVVFIVFISMVVYMVVQPRPLLYLYISFFPIDMRDKAERALTKTSEMLIGWIRSNIIGGGIEAVSVTVFLSFMNVPGAWVWGGLAFFSELIPKIGFYLMAIPPVLVALSISPVTALWVTVFYLALNEIIGDFIMPKLRSSTMKLHPVSTLFLLLAMGVAFGLPGALIATPMAAIFKAYYEEFYLSRFKEDTKMEKRIENIIYRAADDPENQ